MQTVIASCGPLSSLHRAIGWQLAFQFRGTRQQDERQRIAADYAIVVERLIKSGKWDEMPAPEAPLKARRGGPDDFDASPRRLG